MKKLLLTLFLCGAAALSAQAASFSQFFNADLGPGTDHPATDMRAEHGWYVYDAASGGADIYDAYGYGDVGLINGTVNGVTGSGGLYFAGLSDGVSSTGTDSDDHAGFAGGHRFGFLFATADAGSGITPGAWMFTTNNLATDNRFDDVDFADWYNEDAAPLAGTTLGELTTLTTTLRQRSDGAFDYRFALEVNGQWLVSEDSFLAIDTGPPGYEVWEPKSLDLAGTSWIADAFTPGAALDTDLSDNTAQSLDSFGLGSEVTGYGIYVGGVDNADLGSWVRFNSYHVEVVPEPSALALLGLGGLALALIRRRR